MRDLDELEINEGGNPVKLAPPTESQVRAFETHFGVKLPHDFLQLLRHSNGGCPVLDAFEPKGLEEPELCGINRFHFLNDDREDTEGLWWSTCAWQHTLGPGFVAIGGNGGGDEIVLNFSYDPPSVQMCFHEEDFELVDVADSFGEFIDMLQEDPDEDDEDGEEDE